MECHVTPSLQAEPLEGPAPGPEAKKSASSQDDHGVDVALGNRRHGETSRCGWLVRAARSITVEPVLFAYMFAFMLTSVVEQNFYVDRACRAHLNLSDWVCSHINDKDHEDDLKRVQVREAT